MGRSAFIEVLRRMAGSAEQLQKSNEVNNKGYGEGKRQCKMRRYIAYPKDEEDDDDAGECTITTAGVAVTQSTVTVCSITQWDCNKTK